MRPKINSAMLARAQLFARSRNHPILQQLYASTYQLINQMLSPVNRTFNRVCIHGNYPQLIIPLIQNQLEPNSHLALCSSIRQPISPHTLDLNVEYLSEGEFVRKDNQYDLIVSCLEGHHGSFDEKMKDYMESLQPDGAIVGCTWAENTLKELNWAYMMAENERCGGISPKVYRFPSIGGIGNVMHAAKVQIPTIVVKDAEIEVESVVDILTLLQLTGQSGILHGRRKGVYPDLLLAMCALYDTEFRQQDSDFVKFSLEFALFIGWKYHESQKQPLSRSKIVNRNFFEELKKFDPDLEQYTIGQEDDDDHK